MITSVKILKNLPAALAKERELVNKYETHSIFKAFEIFVILKELTTSGKIQNLYGSHDEFMKCLAEECNVSRNTMYSRIKLLVKFKLITVEKNKDILLTSWDEIAKQYNIKSNQFHTIELNNESPKIEYILRTMTFSEHKERQAFQFTKFINTNNQVKEYIIKELGELPKTIQDMAEFVIQKQVLSFKNWSDGFDFWHSLYADFNASVNKIMYYFQFKDFRQVAYWKKQLTKKGLIIVRERKHESQKCTRLATNVFTKQKVKQTMFWNGETKTKVWQQPDLITITL